MRRYLLCLLCLGGQMLASDFPPVEKTLSPNKRFAVVMDDEGRVSIEDVQRSKEIGLILEGSGIDVEGGLVRWSPDGSKVAVKVGHRKWNETYLLARKGRGFRKIHFHPPDALTMYVAHTPPNYPHDVGAFRNNDTVGEWLDNSRVSMQTSYIVEERKSSDSISYTISTTYVLQITHGRARVRNAKLTVARRS